MTDETTTTPTNLKTFFDAAHTLNDVLARWVTEGNTLVARRDALIEISPKCGVHKTATRDALAKVSLATREKKPKEPSAAPILDFINGAGDEHDGGGEGAHA